jgi:hypothetical protein
MNNMMNPMSGFIQGSQLASQQANDGLGQQRQRDEQAMRAIQMIGSISLGAKGGSLDGQVDPAKFEQGLDFLQQNGVNVASYRGRPEVADVAARASMSALQQIQGGMAAQQAALQLQATLVGIQQRQQQIGLQASANERQSRAAEIAAGRAGLPEGYERGPDGSARRIAGLPPAGASATPQSTLGKLNSDLARGAITREQFDLEQERITKQGATPLASSQLASLSGAASDVDTAKRLLDGFNDQFAGHFTETAGTVRNELGRRGITLGGNLPDYGPQAAWWADYQRFKNIDRNALFGAALTATEKAEFEKATINPGMSAEQVRINLKRQADIVNTAMRRMVEPLVAQGRDTAEIEGAIGRKLTDLGITTQSRRQAPQPPSATSTPAPAQSSSAASAAAPAASPRVIGPAPQGAPEGRTGRLPDGTRVRVTNGQLVVVE